MSRRPSGSRVLLAAVLLVSLLVSARAEERTRPLLVLGPDGTPVHSVGLLRVTQRWGECWLVDEDASPAPLDVRGGRVDVPVAAQGEAEVLVLPGASPVVVPPPGLVTGVRLLAAVPLRGRIRFSGGRPAAGVDVFATPDGGRAGLALKVRTDPSGAYRFLDLAPGRWDLAVRRSDGRVWPLGVFTAGEAAPERVLAPGSRVEGLILRAGTAPRAPVPGLAFRLRRVGETAPRASTAAPAIRTDAHGRFVVPDLPEGVYEAVLVDPAWFFEPAPPKLQSFREGRLDLPAFFARPGVAVLGRVEGATGTPVEGARVGLAFSPTEPAPAEGWPALPSLRSGADGRFRFEGVRPASGYRVVVAAPGWASAVGAPFDVGVAPETSAPTIHLSRGWRLAVRARAPGGAVLARAHVVAVPASHAELTLAGAAFRTLAVSGDTNADGEAVLDDLPGEDVRVAVRLAGYASTSGLVEYPRSGDVKVFNATLFPLPQLRGRVEKEPGYDPGPLVVEARPRDGTPPARVDAATSDGAFVFHGLEPVATDFLVEDAKGLVLARDEAVVPGTGRDLVLLVTRPHAVKGRIEGATPGPDVRVELLAARYDTEAGGYEWTRVAETKAAPVGPDLAFTFAGLAESAYALRARQGDNETALLPVHAEGDADVTDAVLTFEIPGRIAGAVASPDHLPVLGAVVRLLRIGESAGADLPAREIARTATDADGAYVFEEVAPGAWRIEAEDAGVASDGEVVRLGAGESQVVRDLILGPGGTLEGTLADAGGRPLDGVRLGLERLGEEASNREGASGVGGAWRVVALRPGTWRVRVLSPPPGVDVPEALVDVVAGETTHLDLAPLGRGTLGGTVTREGRPIGDVSVHLVSVELFLTVNDDVDDAGAKQWGTRTAPDGRFSFPGLLAGRYELDLAEGGAETRYPVTLRDGDTLDLDLEIGGARIVGSVETVAETPVGGALVHLVPSRGTAGALEGRVRTAPDGRFVVSGLPGGARFDLEVSAPGLPPGRARDVRAEEPGAGQPVTVILGRGGTLALVVRNDVGRGVIGTRVWIEDEEGAVLNPNAYATGAGGRLRVTGVPEGRWRLVLHALGYGRPARVPFRVREGETTPLAVELPPAGSLRLTVTTPGLDPVTRARIAVLRLPEGEPVVERASLRPVRLSPLWGRVPRTGVLVVDDLAPGSYRVAIDAGPAFEPTSVEVKVVAGEETELSVPLPYSSGR